MLACVGAIVWLCVLFLCFTIGMYVVGARVYVALCTYVVPDLADC